MSSQEIITFQLGNYSNFVGTHYWNSQYKRYLRDVEHDSNTDSGYETNKLFRRVCSYKNASLVPRLISFDVKHSLKALKEDGSFQEKDTDLLNDAKEERNCKVYAQSPIPKNELLSNPECVGSTSATDISSPSSKHDITTWSDILTHRLHENTLQLLSNSYDDGKNFNYFGLGQQEYESLYDNIEDKLHFWIEECNAIEGFQVFTEIHNGFSGLSSKLLEDLNDEYAKKPSVCYINWPVVTNRNEEVYRDLNLALAFQAFREHSSLFVLQSLQRDIFSNNSGTVDIPSICYQPKDPYHTSALLAAAIDATTLPWRESNRKVSLSSLCHHISQSKWKLASSAIGFSAYSSITEPTIYFEKLYKAKCFYGPCLSSFFPVSALAEITPSSHSVVLQNISEHQVIPDHFHPNILSSLGLNRNVFTNNPETVLEFFNERYYPSEKTISNCWYSNKPLETSLPFPPLFPGLDLKDRNKVSVMSSLFTCDQFYNLLSELVKRLQRINLHRHHIVGELGLDNDLYTELVENLVNFSYEYNPQGTFE